MTSVVTNHERESCIAWTIHKAVREHSVLSEPNLPLALRHGPQRHAEHGCGDDDRPPPPGPQLIGLRFAQRGGMQASRGLHNVRCCAGCRFDDDGMGGYSHPSRRRGLASPESCLAIWTAVTRTSAVPAITSYQRYQPIEDNPELQVSQFAVSSRAKRDFGYKPMKGFTARTVPYSRSC
jgi:hypothetical protein